MNMKTPWSQYDIPEEKHNHGKNGTVSITPSNTYGLRIYHVDNMVVTVRNLIDIIMIHRHRLL